MLTAEILKFILAGFLLVVSSSFLVRSLIKLSRFLQLSEFAISFILMAFATSVPELFVGITSALEGQSTLAFGLAIGSNIVDLTLVLGIAAIFAKKIKVKSILDKHDSVYMSIIAVLVLLLSGDGVLSRADGIILLIIYGVYVWNLFTQKSYFKRKNYGLTRKQAVIQLLIFIASIATLLIGANLIVSSAEGLSTLINVPLILIGLIFIALGTSLPELAFEISAIHKDHKSLALGDLIGSVVTNSALVIGLVAIISPIIITDLTILRSSFLFLLLALIGFNIFMFTKKELDRWEGLVLLVIYIAYVSTEYILQI